MNIQTPFNLPVGQFAQPSMETKALVINGQNLVDAFADCDLEQCDKLAAMLDQGRYESFGRAMFNLMRDWSEQGN